MADLARIKNNVAKMAAQNAPEQDIDGYIASEGVTIDDVRNFKAQQPTETQKPAANPASEGGIYDIPGIGKYLKGFNDFTHNVQTGFADAATLGTADEINAAINAPLSGKTYDELVKQGRDDLANSGTAGTIGQVAGALMSGPTSAIKNVITRGVVEGGLYGLGSGEGNITDRLPGAAVGAGVGGLVGGVGNKLLDKFGSKINTDAIDSLTTMGKKAETKYTDALANARDATPTEVSNLAADLAAKKAAQYKVGDTVLGAPSAVTDVTNAIAKTAKKGDVLPANELHNARKLLSDSFSPMMAKADKRAITTARNQIDDVLSQTAPEMKAANDFYRQKSNAELVNSYIAKASKKADETTASLGSAIKSQFAKLGDKIDAGKVNGFSPDHVALIKDIAATESPIGKGLQNIGATMNPFTLRGALANFGTGALTGVGLPAHVATWAGGKALYKVGSKMSDKAYQKAKLLDYMLRAGVNKIEDLPTTNTKFGPLLKQFNEHGPYVTAVSVNDIRNDGENR